MKKIAASIVASVLLASAGSAAASITIVAPTTGARPLFVLPETMITDFGTSSGLSGTYSLETGSLYEQYAAPLGDTSQYLAVRKGQSAALALNAQYSELSVYLGSIDKFNTISFFDGTTELASFTGDMIPLAPANGNQTSNLNNTDVTFSFGGAKVTSVVFSSAENAFELDTVRGVPTAVPEPATWALMVTGFCMMGTSVRRRLKAKIVFA